MYRIIVNFFTAIFLIINTSCQDTGIVMTVNGPIASKDMGQTLVHEHVLVEFRSQDTPGYGEWDTDKVTKCVMPYLQEIRALGCQTFIECTPVYLGRDPLLLQALSKATGLNIITNTGYYKNIPAFASAETADQLANRWIEEWNNGIGSTGIKPGFIKIAVDPGHLSEIHQKLVAAAAKTYLMTGLTIVSHTGPSIPAFEQIELLKKEGVSPEAFIWVHAQEAAKDSESHIKAAQMGAWVSLDGLNDDNVSQYVDMILNMKKNKLIHKVLISHDAGWYNPGQENGGFYRHHATIFNKLIPALKEKQFTDKDIRQLLVVNPAKAHEVRIRKLKK